VIIKRPEILKISVTGHRLISNSETQLAHSIRWVLKRISNEYENSDIHLYSALAEGSDQLVAEIALEFKNIGLYVPLPMTIMDYLRYFSSNSAQEKFHDLLLKANKIELLSDMNNNQDAFQTLGFYLVEQADILLAVWNGEFNQKKGGTSEVVKIALTAGKLVYWIYCPNEAPDANNSLISQKEIGELKKLGSSE